jgi:hypothetical protein
MPIYLAGKGTVKMSEVIELGPFSPDITEAVRQLKQDMRDDWYPDSLGYEDALDPKVAASLISKSFEDNHGLWVPEDRTELNIPKKGFVLRYSLEMSLLDRLYYQALVGHLVPYYDPLLPNRVLNHRYAASGNRSGRYLFKHPIEQWELFKGYVELEARMKPVVMSADVQNYYENIQVDRIINVLQENISAVKATGSEKAQIRRIIGELDRCLRKWCYKPTHGLPQNRDASSFLANLVMLPVDQAMLKKGYVYYRYMDDIRVVASTRYQARASLQHLTMELRGLGLNLNSAKTTILEPGMKDYEKVLGKDEPILAEIDNMWRSRSPQVIRRSFVPLQRLALDLISQSATQERAFRFCVQRFENLALCSDLSVPDSFFAPMTNACINELDAQPHSSDKIVRFLKVTSLSTGQMNQIVSLLADHERSIYDWQNYLLWQLLVYKKHSDPTIIATARERAAQPWRAADRAGAILFLGAMGSDDDRKLIAKSFSSCREHLVQRNALIAVHEVDYNEGIKQHVAEHVLPSLRGTYKRLRSSSCGQYFRPLPNIPAINIYDEMSAYD